MTVAIFAESNVQVGWVRGCDSISGRPETIRCFGATFAGARASSVYAISRTLLVPAIEGRTLPTSSNVWSEDQLPSPELLTPEHLTEEFPGLLK